MKNLSAKPACVNGERFAEALIDVISRPKDLESSDVKSLEAIIDGIDNEQLKQTLLVLYNEAKKDVNQFRVEIASWFDDVMDRVSGW